LELFNQTIAVLKKVVGVFCVQVAPSPIIIIPSKSIFFSSMPVINHKKMEVCSGVKRNFDLIPQQYFRKQVNKRGSLSKRLNAIIKKAKIKIPFDCKTSIGLRGSAVKKSVLI
jgi:hypothetical protein